MSVKCKTSKLIEGNPYSKTYKGRGGYYYRVDNKDMVYMTTQGTYDGYTSFQTQIRFSTKELLKFASFHRKTPMFKIVDMAIVEFLKEDKKVMEKEYEALKVK